MQTETVNEQIEEHHEDAQMKNEEIQELSANDLQDGLKEEIVEDEG